MYNDPRGGDGGNGEETRLLLRKEIFALARKGGGGKVNISGNKLSI